ncbi:MAG: hypothetical protein R3E95_10665 [Thiolinea sp.]
MKASTAISEFHQDGGAVRADFDTVGALSGYVLTKWRFPGHRWVFGPMLFGCFIPFRYQR